MGQPGGGGVLEGVDYAGHGDWVEESLLGYGVVFCVVVVLWLRLDETLWLEVGFG